MWRLTPFGVNGKRLQKAIEHGHLNSEFPHEKWWIFP